MSAFSSLRHLIKVCSAGQVQKDLLNFSLTRNIRAETKVKWIRPAKVPSYLPIKTGDQSDFEMPDPKSVRKYFENCEKLKNCSNEIVHKIFSMEYQSNLMNYKRYKENLIDSVKAHKYDETSEEVKIAALTADIRLKQYLWSLRTSNRKIRCEMNELIHKRCGKLMKLRKTDYKRYEWLLEKLNLIYKPMPILPEAVTRKKSVRLLAELGRKKLEEQKLAHFKSKLDDMKVPYLEKKLKKLLWIQEQETNLQLTPTVSESDIEDCRKEIETIKLEVEDRCKKGYIRKVHPYTLEVHIPKEKSTT